jgi:hypothetical protein
MAGFEVSTYGRLWVSTEASYSCLTLPTLTVAIECFVGWSAGRW